LPPNSEPSEREILWRDYALNAQLYQFYLDASLKLNVFYYAITGGILSFCLAREQTGYIRWALMLPLIMSGCFAFLLGYSSFLAKTLSEDTALLAEKLGLSTYHEFSPLVFVLRAFSVLQLCCAIGIAYLFWKLSA
jgi:hypothetical protein